MKKIMFNDQYGLTNAVLQGRKTMTRRIVPKSVIDKVYEYQLLYYNQTFAEISFHDALINMNEENMIKSSYKIGEVVAVAQSYNTILNELENSRNFSCMEHWESKSSDRAKYAEMAMYSPGGINKMFVRASLMPHQIRITDIKVERLQDISDEDCLKEGIYYYETGGIVRGYPFAAPFYYTFSNAVRNGNPIHWTTPREAFAVLIDKVSGRGTWNSNPWVFAYSFELIK